MDNVKEVQDSTSFDARAEWVRPEIRRIRAGDAEVTGATSDDGVIGNS
jgi:hypothetical protein